MPDSRFDVLVVGAGPAGSVAAYVLAAGGARVALLDKAEFPRDKACGDLIGPRGVQLLADLGLPMPTGPRVGPMLVCGPNGRQVRLPSAAGETYPDHGLATTRTGFDASLHAAALDAGAVPLVGRAGKPLWSGQHLVGFEASTRGDTSMGREIRADFVIGADGATSRVAAAAGLIDERRVLWGFAIRAYHRQPVELPAIVLWESAPWQGFPGYGWIFPGADGGANLGLGVGTGSDRAGGTQAVRAFPEFVAHLHGMGFLSDGAAADPARRLGGWLKMGMVGTTPATGRVLLVGDAAGLVNPLQGEGISQAMLSGRWAAQAVLGEPLDGSGRDDGRLGAPGGQRGSRGPAVRYRAALAAHHLPYQRISAALQSAIVGRPRAVAAVARLLTTAARGDPLAGGWAVFWNELLDGAPPGTHRTVASAATWLGSLLTSRTETARWFEATLQAAPACAGGRQTSSR
jgi:menaquinone-9 beta-reductase